MKKKFSVPAKDKKDWINFTKESGNIISKDDDSLEENQKISKISKVRKLDLHEKLLNIF